MPINEMMNESEFVEVAIDCDPKESIELSMIQDVRTSIDFTNTSNTSNTTPNETASKKQFYNFMFKDANVLPLPPRKPWWLYLPIFTIIVTIIELALLIWTISISGFESLSKNPMLGPTGEALLEAGGKWTTYILNKNEGWRLISAMFLHAGIFHFLSNMLVQILMCTMIEMRYGTPITFIVYMMSGITGNVMSAIFLPQFITIGSSGALFGLLGFFIVEIVKYFKQLMFPWFTIGVTIVTILLSFGLGLLPYVDNFAHIGGFVMGIPLGMLLIPNVKTDIAWRRYTGLIVRGLGAVLGVIVFVGLFLVLYLVKVPASEWCPNCKYINCIPRIVDGVDWCDGF